MSRIMLVDEDPKKLNILSTLLKTEGYRVIPILGLAKALGFVKAQQFNLMIFDISGEPESGIEVVRKSRESRPDTNIIVLIDASARETANAIRDLSLCRIVEKPFKPAEFIGFVQRVVDFGNAMAGDRSETKTSIKLIDSEDDFIARSPAMQEVRDMIKRVALTDISITVIGEEGVDRAQIAGTVHASSNRRSEKLVSLDCAALAENELETFLWGNEKENAFLSAEGGTLFLDHLEAMPLSIQEKLAGVLASKQMVCGKNKTPTNIRLIAGTTSNLTRLVEKGIFNSTLLKQIGSIPITVKPLRERKEDIVPMAEKLVRNQLEDRCPEPVFSPELEKILTCYPWPGNSRELREVVEKITAGFKDDAIAKADFPQELVCAAEAAMARQQKSG